MNKIVVTADVQLHEHQLWSHVLPSGRNSRLQNGLDCLEQALLLAKKETLVINGDLFHDRKQIAIDVLHGVATVFSRHKDVQIIINTGNHDQCLRDGRIHSLEIFRGLTNVTVVSEPTSIRDGDVMMHFHPFTTDLELFRKWCSGLKFDPLLMNVLFVHQAVDGSKLAKDTIYKGGLSLDDIRNTEVEAVFLGHFHRPQELAYNVWYVGSPYEIDSGEAGDTKRFMILQRGKDKWGVESVPVTGMPRHVRWTSTTEFVEKKGSKTDFNVIECVSRDDTKAVEDLGCRAVVKAKVVLPDASNQGIQVGDVSIEEAVTLALKTRGAENLLDRVKKRLSI